MMRRALGRIRERRPRHEQSKQAIEIRPFRTERRMVEDHAVNETGEQQRLRNDQKSGGRAEADRKAKAASSRAPGLGQPPVESSPRLMRA